MRNVVVVDGFRTPLCKEGTDFRDTDAEVLGAWVVREFITRCHRWNLPLTTIDCVLGSNVATPMHAVNPTRVAAVTGGLPVTIPADTVAGKNCGSGVTALYYASLRIRSGDADAVLAVGMESMSRIPIVYDKTVADLLLRYGKARSLGERVAGAVGLLPKILNLKRYPPRIGLMMGLTDPMCDLIMGATAENMSKDPAFHISREEQDAFAVRSHTRAARAWKQGLFEDEVVPMYVPERSARVARDNGIREDASLETFREVKPVFDRHYGSVTPANSSQITDAAAALLLMEEGKATAFGLPILGYIRDYADFGYEPSCMGMAPVGAIAALLAKTGLSLKDFAVCEINEAFASVVLGITRTLDSSSLMEQKFGRYGWTERLGEIPPDDLNPHGGAIALGHPVGVSGLRLAMTALYELRRRNAERALISACVGGGQGVAMMLERK
ncbi:acetyl-CoA acetyltransferase [Nitrospira sp. KM1]|uniref:thiolase family protein n=1 Tax=Nitrospira sp. KM1 TaxID=1936990 RepID=UPI0013A75DAF|nr:thiolase family protein [Nitrospira sp. KM1]BCA56959.1 acetyl-CoA acetyltransferase [Nitrospira sp. KM1]